MLLPHSITVTATTASTPVALAELKSHLLIEHDLDDTLLAGLLDAAAAHAARECGLFLVPTTVEIGFRELCGDRIELPVWPLRSLTSAHYLDADGVTQPLTGYQSWLTHRPPLISPSYGLSWPTTRRGALRAAWVTCAVGPATAAQAPDPAKQAVKLIAAYGYGFKGDSRDMNEAGIPPAARRFLDYLREDYYR